MAKIICHHNGRYNFYCTISDGFTFVSSLSLEQIKTVIEKEQGIKGLYKLPERLERAHRNGHSGISSENLDAFLCANRAGDQEDHLTTQQCISRFLS